MRLTVAMMTVAMVWQCSRAEYWRRRAEKMSAKPPPQYQEQSSLPQTAPTKASSDSSHETPRAARTESENHCAFLFCPVLPWRCFALRDDDEKDSRTSVAVVQWLRSAGTISETVADCGKGAYPARCSHPAGWNEDCTNNFPYKQSADTTTLGQARSPKGAQHSEEGGRGTD